MIARKERELNLKIGLRKSVRYKCTALSPCAFKKSEIRPHYLATNIYIYKRAEVFALSTIPRRFTPYIL